MTGTVIFILLIVALIVSWLYLPRLMVMRAIPAVIRTFRRGNAVGPGNARMPAELGFRQKSFIEGMFQLRDYKPMALQILIQAKIIEMTGDGKLYLSEQKLAETRWKNVK